MKGTSQFKKVISGYLERMAENDSIFAEKMKAENKSLDTCIDYIITQVHKKKCAAWTDKEIFGIAVHYYDEPNDTLGDITPASEVDGSVVTCGNGVDNEPAKKASKKVKPACNEQLEIANQLTLFEL